MDSAAKQEPLGSLSRVARVYEYVIISAHTSIPFVRDHMT